MTSRTSGTELHFKTRGIILSPEELTLEDWPERIARAGLNTVATHVTPTQVMAFVRTEAGQRFLSRCRELGLEVEHELHAMRELLPRELFDANPELFRMDDSGNRTPDANLCVHSPRALEIAAESAARIAETLRPTTGRYFYWGDDGKPWCHCPHCRSLSDSDQALVLENHLLGSLRRMEARAHLAHLAYLDTTRPPTQVRPEPGIFLEYAPIRRRYDLAYSGQHAPGCEDPIEALDANLEWFGAEGAQALEYWLDASRFSRYRRPAVRIPWDAALFRADLEDYARRGVRHFTSFAIWLDSDYVARFGDPPVNQYGEALRSQKS